MSDENDLKIIFQQKKAVKK